MVKGMKSKCDIRLYHTESLYKTENEQFSTFLIQGFKTRSQTFLHSVQLNKLSNIRMKQWIHILQYSVIQYLYLLRSI